MLMLTTSFLPSKKRNSHLDGTCLVGCASIHVQYNRCSSFMEELFGPPYPYLKERGMRRPAPQTQVWGYLTREAELSSRTSSLVERSLRLGSCIRLSIGSSIPRPFSRRCRNSRSMRESRPRLL